MTTSTLYFFPCTSLPAVGLCLRLLLLERSQLFHTYVYAVFYFHSCVFDSSLGLCKLYFR